MSPAKKRYCRFPHTKEVILARDNYSFKKRARELAQKKKQEEKRQRKLDKKNALPQEDLSQSPNDGVVAEPLSE